MYYTGFVFRLPYDGMELILLVILQGRRKVCKGGEAESCYVVALPREARGEFSRFSFPGVKILAF